MSAKAAFEIKDFVRVYDVPNQNAVRIDYDRLFDADGLNIPATVRAAALLATEKGRNHWVCDTVNPRDDLSDKDAAWVATQEFRDILLTAPVTDFWLIPAADDADGVDNSWIPGWQRETEAGFGGRIAVHVLSEADVIAGIDRANQGS